MPIQPCHNLEVGAVSSAVEHYVHIVGVAGSNPVPPTILVTATRANTWIGSSPMATVECPYCRKEATIDAGFFCESCGVREPGEDAANDFVEIVLGICKHRTVTEGGDWPITDCDWCGSEAFVDFGPQEDPEGGRAALCFNCGNEIEYKGIDEPGFVTNCSICGRLFDTGDDSTVCEDCFEKKLSQE